MSSLRTCIGVLMASVGILTCSAALAQTAPDAPGASQPGPFADTVDLGLSARWRQDDNAAGDAPSEAEDEEFQDDTGTDPRDFRNKLMPYYRYTELRNGVFIHEGVLFGLYAFSPSLAFTYEIPIARYTDVSEPRSRLPFGGQLPPPPIPGLGGGSIPDDDNKFGIGDSIFRLFWKPKALSWDGNPATWGPKKGEKIGGSFMPLIETTVPTHTDDLLGTDHWLLSPGFAIAQSTPTMGFIAAMFFYDFTATRESDVAYTSRFRGRIFMMQPLSKPGPNFLDGIYLMPEFQPIYDMRAAHFSFWIGPEFGKVFIPENPGTITSTAFYLKPGWGIGDEPSDREWTFEVGLRLFF